MQNDGAETTQSVPQDVVFGGDLAFQEVPYAATLDGLEDHGFASSTFWPASDTMPICSLGFVSAVLSCCPRLVCGTQGALSLQMVVFVVDEPEVRIVLDSPTNRIVFLVSSTGDFNCGPYEVAEELRVRWRHGSLGYKIGLTDSERLGHESQQQALEDRFVFPVRHRVLTQLDLLKFWKENTLVDLAGSESLDGMKVVNFKPQVFPFVFPVGLFTSCQYSSMNKWRNCTFDRSSLGAALTVSAQEQTDHAGVKVEGPFKRGDYRY